MVKIPSMVVSGTDSEHPMKIDSPKATKMDLTFLITIKTWGDCRTAMQKGTDFP